MKGLLPASGSTFQLILEHLWGALLVVSESLKNIPDPPSFSWKILVCVVVLLVIVKRRHTSKNVKLLDKRSPAHDEVCGIRRENENAGPTARADKVLRSPGAEASPPTLQTLCFLAMKAVLSKSSFRGNVKFPEKAQDNQRLLLPQVTDRNSILKSSKKGGEKFQKTMGDLNKITCFPEGSELLAQEIARQKQRLKKMKEKERLVPKSKSRAEEVLNGKISQLTSTAEHILKTIPLLDLLGDHVGDGNLKVPQKKEAENSPRSIYWSEADLKGVIGDADFNTSLWSPKERAQPLWEEEQMNEGLPGQISSFEAEEMSLQCKNSQLEGDIQQLKQRFQTLRKIFKDDLTKLQKKFLEEELHCLEVEKKLASVCKKIKSATEVRDLYKKMAEDLGKGWKRISSYHQNEIYIDEKRAEARGMAAVSTERKLKELRKENERYRHMLAKVKSKFQPFPRGFGAPAAPFEAHGGRKVSGDAQGHQAPQGGGGSCPEGSGI